MIADLTIIGIGIIFNLLMIYLLKNTRVKYNWWNNAQTDVPVLTMGGLIAILLSSIIPVINIIVFIICMLTWVINIFASKHWRLEEDTILYEFIQFLNKPIE